MSNPGKTPSISDFLTNCFSPGRFAALLALLIFATFPQVLLGLQTFVVRDYGFFAHPLAHFQQEAFRHGELPLWNPLNNCGVPFLAQWNTMPLYPPALIYLALPLTWSLSFFCLAHQWFAGLGAYYLARRWTGNNFAAAFAGVAFAFNGLTLNLLMWPSHIATFAWMPWVVLFTERAWREGGRMIFVAAFVGAMQMLGGGPETILFTWLLLAALWVMEAVRAAKGTRLQIGFRFPAVVILVAALAAAQLLPFLDLVAHSQRDAGYADSRWAMPARGWANFFVPMAFGRFWNMGVFFQHDQAWTSSYYLGIATTLLVLLALWRTRDVRVWLLALAAAVALAFAFGDNVPPVRWLREVIPQLRLTTYPVKYVLLVAFLAPQLAAFAVARIHKSGDETNNKTPSLMRPLIALGTVFLITIALIVVWTSRAPMPNDNPHATLINGISRAALLIVSVGLLFLLLRKHSLARFAPLALLLMMWVDVFTHEPTQNPTVAPWIYEPGLVRTKLEMQPQPIAGESRAMIAPLADKEFTSSSARGPADNFLVKRLVYFANCNLLDDVPKVNGFFSLYPREIGELMSAIYSSTKENPAGLIDFMGVSQITSPTNFMEWKPRATALPLITGGQMPVYIDDTNAVSELFAHNFDPARFVVLPPAMKAQISVTNASTIEVLGWKFGRERIDCEVATTNTALVTIAQTYYHCWRAFVDERPAPLLRANFAFQAIEITPGKHRLRLVYQDRAFRVGVIVSLAGLVTCVIGLILFGRNRRA